MRAIAISCNQFPDSVVRVCGQDYFLKTMQMGACMLTAPYKESPPSAMRLIRVCRAGRSSGVAAKVRGVVTARAGDVEKRDIALRAIGAADEKFLRVSVM